MQSFTNASRHIVDEDDIKLTSVGVDIGSSTSHLVFSRLEMRQQGTRYVVTKREILSESEILLTPYRDDLTIDVDALGKFIERQYERAGLKREEIDTGALILTGVAVRRRNARAIAELFAAEAGRFVAVSAGDSLESTMAAHGSGAAASSARSGGVCMNVDIGGGTSKVAITQNGKVVDTCAVEVGARLVAMDEQGKINRLEDTGVKIAKEAGIDLKLGGTMSDVEKEKMSELLCDSLFAVLERGKLSPFVQNLLLTPNLDYTDKVDAIMFSGGVSEYVYGQEKRNLGDLGNQLGRRVREAAEKMGKKIPLKPADVRIRATVIGASQYTVQVSGNTIYLSHPDLLPLRNLQVVTPEFEQVEPLAPGAVKAAVLKALQRFDIDGERPVALALHWELGPSYPLIRNLAQGVADAMKDHVDKGQPLVLVFDADIAKLVGNILERELLAGAGIISIDGIDLKDFDFVDIGEELPDARAVPVVIKSLIFRHTETGRGHHHHHHHHHDD